MDYIQRELSTKFLIAMANALDNLEGLQKRTDANAGALEELVKIQHELVNLQTRFSRLAYISGEVIPNE